jgi:hypothetical protein
MIHKPHIILSASLYEPFQTIPRVILQAQSMTNIQYLFYGICQIDSTNIFWLPILSNIFCSFLFFFFFSEEVFLYSSADLLLYSQSYLKIAILLPQHPKWTQG